MDKMIQTVAAEIEGLEKIYEKSIEKIDGAAIAMARIDGRAKMIVVADDVDALAFEGEAGGEAQCDGRVMQVLICPLSVKNARALQKAFSWANPVALGVKGAFGAGDRLGSATPGHVRALSRFNVAPIFAQQSIREMTRTRRTPDDVMASAIFGILQEGYRGPWGADADHLKTVEDINLTVAAGFTMFTFDPSDHVRPEAFTMDEAELGKEFAALDGAGDILQRWADKRLVIETDEGDVELSLDEEGVKRCAVGYMAALADVKKMHDGLMAVSNGRDMDVEVSFDETDEPTPPATHFFLATELTETGVKFESLALRFVGEFQKGIDYRGDLAEFRKQYRLHAVIAQKAGPYKLSIHSGSDKFTVYPIIGRESKRMVHVKTAGTSYLEAVRVVSRKDPELYRAIHKLALDRFETDRASYHVTTDLSVIKRLDETPDDQLDHYLELDDSRQLIHITYGSVLADSELSKRLFECLDKFPEDHYNTVGAHISKHLALVGFEKVG